MEQAQILQAQDRAVIEKMQERKTTAQRLEVVKVCIDAIVYRDLNKLKTQRDMERKEALENFERLSRMKEKFHETANDYQEKEISLEALIVNTKEEQRGHQAKIKQLDEIISSSRIKLDNLTMRDRSIKQKSRERNTEISQTRKTSPLPKLLLRKTLPLIQKLMTD